MRKVIDINVFEKRWYFFWKKFNYFFKKKFNGFFSVLLPPPNITGNLHMGHAFQNNLIDVFLRFNSLMGKNVFLQGGTDHAGIASQILLERKFFPKLNGLFKFCKNNKFYQNVKNWVFFSQKHILYQVMSLGTCLNWITLRFTLDFDYLFLVTQSFIYLYDVNVIYKGLRLVNWDPVLMTAISDLEVVYKEEICKLWFIKYKVNGCNSYVEVATTRPETIFGDVALAVNSNDDRYKNLLNYTAIVPLVNRCIPIIFDENVDVNFGSGCMKITPAHDFFDFEFGKKHSLPIINIFNDKLQLNKNVPLNFRFLDRFIAREKILNVLKLFGSVSKELLYKTKVCRGDRSNAIIEPLLTKQWFVKMNSLKHLAKNELFIKNFSFIPTKWKSVYLNWISKSNDWCISRKLWWGHRLPIWYDMNGYIYAGYNKKDICFIYDMFFSNFIHQENNVLDTWFSSALWPFSFLKMKHNLINFKFFFSTTLLVTGFDIIFFWVVRMVLFSLRFTKKLPFTTVFIHGLIRDSEGKKMSKFKGNILDPLDLIYGIDFEMLLKKRYLNILNNEKLLQIKIYKDTRKQFPCGIKPFGIDVLRFSFFSVATENLFLRFDSSKLMCFKLFCNKLWNVSRYIFLFTYNVINFQMTTFYSYFEKWILSKWFTVKLIIFFDYLPTYRINRVSSIMYDFVMNDFCFWYIEFTKVNTFDFSSNYTFGKTCQSYLLMVFEEIIRCLHPILPFLTEEIWQKFPFVYKKGKQSIMQTCFDDDFFHINSFRDENLSVKVIDFLKKLVYKIRVFRSSKNIKNTCILVLYPFLLNHLKLPYWFSSHVYRSIFFTLCNVVIIPCFTPVLINSKKKIFFDKNLIFFVIER